MLILRWINSPPGIPSTGRTYGGSRHQARRNHSTGRNKGSGRQQQQQQQQQQRLIVQPPRHAGALVSSSGERVPAPPINAGCGIIVVLGVPERPETPELYQHKQRPAAVSGFSWQISQPGTRCSVPVEARCRDHTGLPALSTELPNLLEGKRKNPKPARQRRRQRKKLKRFQKKL